MKDSIHYIQIPKKDIVNKSTNKGRILVVPLNWGLGHATRCIPIIKALQSQNYEVLLASDGAALQLLQKEFPELTAISLPPYQIQYAKKGRYFKLKLIAQLPKIYRAIRAEQRLIKKIVEDYHIHGLISDNRLGAYGSKIPSVFITHQLNVLTGNTSWITSKTHQYFIKKFQVCWVPDTETKPNLSGKLGHLDKTKLNIQYIGSLSRLHKKATTQQYDLLVLLSGPEPQRSLLEKKINKELKKYQGKVLLVRGVIEEKQHITERLNQITYNYMTSEQLELAFNQSEIVLTRSGYTTIMDLAQLGKKAFFIPTPGQYEQEYLAKNLDQKGLVPYASQSDFKIEMLSRVPFYKGLKQKNPPLAWAELFRLFERK